MDMKQTLTEIESGFWETSGDGGFYHRHMDERGLCVFPQAVMDRSATIEGVSAAAPWDSYSIESARVVVIADDVAALVYEAHAERDGDDPYEARVTSVYRKQDGGWKLVLHQQSPV